MEEIKRSLLAKREAEWKFKSRAIWLAEGNENTIFFQNYAKHRTSINTIWEIKNQKGFIARSFKEIAEEGRKHFDSLFHETTKGNNAEILRVDLPLILALAVNCNSHHMTGFSGIT